MQDGDLKDWNAELVLLPKNMRAIVGPLSWAKAAFKLKHLVFMKGHRKVAPETVSV
jgi:hypothetical protein